MILILYLVKQMYLAKQQGVRANQRKAKMSAEYVLLAYDSVSFICAALNRFRTETTIIYNLASVFHRRQVGCAGTTTPS